ncbi:MAG: MFS transporter [Legionellales bacterium]|nr:MFS transporter [Legionellales bacterium]
MIKHQTRIILAGMMGNLIEAFDMAICGLLSIYFAKYLMGDANKGLAIVFVTFFAGYLARPIGAAFLGLFSDTYGRKIMLAVSILSMGIATALMGFIPSQSSIGMNSMVILLILRVIQSFSCGAEYLNSSTYLVENADATNKGYTGSWASFGAIAGLLVASITALIVARLTSAYPELEWMIWRVPFILGLFGSSIGLYIRICIPESLAYIAYYADHPKPKFNYLLKQSCQFLARNKLQALYAFVLSCLGVTSTFQIYIYAPIQAHIFGHFTDQQIIGSNIIALAVMLCVFPIVGKLSDKISREKIVIAASLGFWFLSQPFFYLLAHGNFGMLIMSQCLISIPAGAYYATVPVMLAEMFPLNLRCTVLSVLYATAASLAAGLTPLLSLMLLRRTNSPVAPTLLIFMLVVIVWGVMRLKSWKSKTTIFTSSVVED